MFYFCFLFPHLPIRSARHIVITFYTIRNPRGFSFAHPTPGGGCFAPLPGVIDIVPLRGTNSLLIHHHINTFVFPFTVFRLPLTEKKGPPSHDR
jgi:hypothetical protein